MLYINITTEHELWHNIHTNEVRCIEPMACLVLTNEWSYLRSEERSVVALMLGRMYSTGDIALSVLRTV